MNNKFTLLAALLLCGFLATAQIVYNTHGDGSLRLLSDRYREWSTQTFEWDDSDSSAYSYNAQGLESENRKFFSPANVWNYARRKTQTYTPTGKILLLIDSNFASAAGSKRSEYAYNANDQETLLTTYRVSSGNWVLEARFQTNYTPFDSINVYLTQQYISNVWENASRDVFAYNAQNRDTSRTYEIWNNNQWKGYTRQIETLNANGSVASVTYQTYDTLSASYKNYSQFTYLYDASNRVISHNTKFWDIANNSWANSSLSSFSYDANGNLEQTLTEEWDFANLEWDLYNLITYTYDTDNKLTKFLLQTRNGSSWVNIARRSYTYNAQGYITNDFQERWDANTLAWVNYQDMAYYYETNPLFNSITESEKTKLFVFPNPSSSPVTFVNAEKNLPYAVFDMQGRMIQQGDLQPGTNSIVLNEVKGIYLLKAGNSTARIVRE